MKILVISDLHAMSTELKNKDAYVGRTGGKLYVENRNPKENQILAMHKALSRYSGQIDILFCVGDIAHQAKKIVTMLAWRDIHDLSKSLGIKEVIAVTGNHDIASRPDDFEEDEPRAFLHKLTPPFPSSDPDFNSSYQSNGIARKHIGRSQIIAIDTCKLHGYGGANASSIFNKGHISNGVIEKLSEFASSQRGDYNIILMHHHPRKIDEIEDRDYDFIANGADLIRTLEQSQTPSLIVHGHKHFVRLTGPGDNVFSPMVFSASSFAANAYEDMERFFSNQFHLIDIKSVNSKNRLVGCINSWDWVGSKWESAKNERMPGYVGFGRLDDVDAIALKIYNVVNRGGSLIGQQARSEVPDLEWCTGEDYEKIKMLLQDRHGVKSMRSPEGDFSFWQEAD